MTLVETKARRPATDALPETEVLFPEARRRARRRYLSRFALLCIPGVVVALVLTSGGNGRGPAAPRIDTAQLGSLPTAATPRGQRAILVATLPGDASYSGLAVVAGRLEVIGTNSNNRSTVCFVSVVNASSLRLGLSRHGTCNNPALQGREVVPVERTSPNFDGTVSISRSSSGAHGYRIGPIVAPFVDLSGGARPEWAYGGGRLWIYDLGTTGGNPNTEGTPPELLEISATTGVVQQIVQMPAFYNPVLVPGNNGLWLYPADEDAGAIWHIASSGEISTPIHLPASDEIRWAVPSGDGLIVDTMASGQQFANLDRAGTISGYVGSQAARAFKHSDEGEIFNPIRDSSGRLWSVDLGYDKRDRPIATLINVDLRTGSPDVARTFDIAQNALSTVASSDPGPGVILDGSLYLLAHNNDPNGNPSYGVIIRIPLPN